MHYRFSVFNYNVDQKILSHNKQVVEIPKKCHELLLYLLENPNKLISRDALIDHVWHGRVVTHNTIDQSILKLRKALNHQYPGEYIESVYGQGIRFLPQINCHEPNPLESTSRIKNNHWLTLASIAVIIVIGAWFLIKPPTRAIIDIENSITLPQDIPNSPITKSSKDDWLLAGGSAYLGYLLHLYPNIVLQKTHRVKATEVQKPHIILDLTTSNNTQWTVQADLYQKPSPENKINSFYADLTLVANEVNLEKKQFQANNLNELFPQISDWIAQYDGLETPQQISDPHVFTENNSALLNFFQGLTLQVGGDSKAALSHFKQATEIDPEFKLAWYEKAIALRKQGDPKKAISVLNALNTDDHWLNFRISVAKGITYNLLDQPIAAIDSYDTALKSAESSNNYDGMAAIYINQAILYSDRNLYKKAEEILLQALDLPTMSKQNQRYGSILNTYAKVAASMNNMSLAIENSKKSIESYQLTGNKRYEMMAKSRLAGYLIQSNEFTQAEHLAKEAMSYAKEIKSTNALISNHIKLASVFQKTGRFDPALSHWGRVVELTIKHDMHGSTANAYKNRFEIHLLQQNPSQARVNLNLLTQLNDEHKDNEIKQTLIEANLIMALFNKDIALSQDYLEFLKTSGFELIQVYQGDVAKLSQQPATAELKYIEALEVAKTMGRFNQIVLIMNKLNALYLNFDSHKLLENVNQTSKLNPFIYPYQKYQAISAYRNGKYIKASSMMEELKLKAGDFWQFEDQLILDTMKNNTF